jgi:integrase
VNIEKEKSLGGLGKYLTPEEFKSLKEGRMPTEGLERARDVFVFQTYTCLSYTDLRGFDARLIQEVKGMKVYIGTRQKTGHSFTIPILPPAWNILEKYNMKLPVVNNVKYNLFLKGVAQSVGIDKPVSSHWARHTGATLLLNEGVDMKVVAKVCGHSSTRITEQVYAKLLDETVVEALHKVKI